MTRTARLLLLLLVLPCLALAQGAPPARTGPLLQRALADPDGVMLRDDGTYAPTAQVNVVYGAADTCVGVATATIAQLLEACRRG